MGNQNWRGVHLRGNVNSALERQTKVRTVNPHLGRARCNMHNKPTFYRDYFTDTPAKNILNRLLLQAPK